MLGHSALSPKEQRTSLPHTRTISQFRLELNEDCLRKQLDASALEKEDTQRRLSSLQEKLAIGSHMREDLKTELRAGFLSLQEQFSETSLRVVSEMRASLNTESGRLQQASKTEFARFLEEAVQRVSADSKMSFSERASSPEDKVVRDGSPQILAAISDLKQSINRVDSTAMNRQLDAISTDLNKLMSAVQLMQHSHIDFSLALRAIQESQATMEVPLLRQAIEDLRRKTDGRPMQDLFNDQKVVLDEHFAHVSKLIGDYEDGISVTRKPQLGNPDESPNRKLHKFDGDFLIVENMLRENALALASGFSQIQDLFRQNSSIKREDSELECAWQNSIEHRLLQLQAAVNQCHADLKESLEKQDTKVDVKPENDRMYDAIQKNKMEVIDQLENAIAQIQQGVSSGVSEHSEHIGHVTKQLEKLTPIHNAFRELRDDMTDCFAQLNHAIRENRTKVDLAPLMDAILERNRIQLEPGTPGSPAPFSAMGGPCSPSPFHMGTFRKMSEDTSQGFLKTMSEDINQGFLRVQGSLQELQSQVDMRPNYSHTNDMLQNRTKELFDKLGNTRSEDHQSPSLALDSTNLQSVAGLPSKTSEDNETRFPIIHTAIVDMRSDIDKILALLKDNSEQLNKLQNIFFEVGVTEPQRDIVKLIPQLQALKCHVDSIAEMRSSMEASLQVDQFSDLRRFIAKVDPLLTTNSELLRHIHDSLSDGDVTAWRRKVTRGRCRTVERTKSDSDVAQSQETRSDAGSIVALQNITHPTHQTNVSAMQAVVEELRVAVAQIGPTVIANNDKLNQIQKTLLEHTASAEQSDAWNVRSEIESLQAKFDGLGNMIRGMNFENEVASMRELVSEVRGSRIGSAMYSPFEDLKNELMRGLEQEQTQKAIAELRKDISMYLLHPNLEIKGFTDPGGGAVSKLPYVDSRLPCTGAYIAKAERRPSGGSLEDQGKSILDAAMTLPMPMIQFEEPDGDEEEALHVIVQGAVEKRPPTDVAGSRGSSLSDGTHADLQALSGLQELFSPDGAIDCSEPDWLVDCS